MAHSYEFGAGAVVVGAAAAGARDGAGRANEARVGRHEVGVVVRVVLLAVLSAAGTTTKATAS